MKKIILIIVSFIMLMSLFALPLFAESDTDYNEAGYFIFNETSKAYPIAEDIEASLPFMQYYGVESVEYTFIPFSTAPIVSKQLKIISFGENIELIIKDLDYDGEYKFISSSDGYQDFAIYYTGGYANGDKNGVYASPWKFNLVGIKNGEKNVVFEDFIEVFPTSQSYPPHYMYKTLPEGYYIGGDTDISDTPTDTDTPDTPTDPEDTTPDTSTDELPDVEAYQGLISITLMCLGAFVAGFGIVFSDAFTAIFISNGVLNALAIFILVISGIGMGCGIIRWITAKFRNKGE